MPGAYHAQARAADEAAGSSYWPAELLGLLDEAFDHGTLGRACDRATRERLAGALDKLLSAAHGELPAGEGKLRRSLAKVRERMLVCVERAAVPPDARRFRAGDQESVLESQVALNQYDDALAVIEDIADADRKKVAGRADRLIAERRELFANGPYPSTYENRLSTTHTPSSTVADAEGNQERFGLVDGQLRAAERSAVADAREGERELSGTLTYADGERRAVSGSSVTPPTETSRRSTPARSTRPACNSATGPSSACKKSTRARRPAS